MVKVEKGIPIPNGNARFPFGQMQRGDSFFVQTHEPDKVRGNVSSNGDYWAKKLGGKFTVRKVDGGLRVWRVK